MAKVIAMTEASRDQDHVRMLVDHNPHVPNRQKAILGDGEDPGPALGEMAAGLEALGADFLVIPCNTAYVFEDAILEVTTIPLISIITESVAAVRSAAPAAKSVGLLATDGCLQAGIYQAGIGRDRRSHDSHQCHQGGPAGRGDRCRNEPACRGARVPGRRCHHCGLHGDSARTR
jgi:aspartate racemase